MFARASLRKKCIEGVVATADRFVGRLQTIGLYAML
jgi:hypothetical protein